MSDLPDGFSLVPPGSGWFGYTTDTTRIEKRYQLTPDEYHAMLVQQDNECAICRRPSTSVGPLYVDHDEEHPQKVVRGLLCLKCNAGIGLFNHDPILLDDARNYILERGSGATRDIARLEREAADPELKEGTSSLELHLLDGSTMFGAIAAKPRLGLSGQTFDKYGKEWRVSKRTPLSEEFGRGAELLVCYEVGS